jgi:hypothetical protein
MEQVTAGNMHNEGMGCVIAGNWHTKEMGHVATGNRHAEEMGHLGAEDWNRNELENYKQFLKKFTSLLAAFPNCEKRLLASSCPSACLSVRLFACNTSVAPGQVLIKFRYLIFQQSVSLKSENGNVYMP